MRSAAVSVVALLLLISSSAPAAAHTSLIGTNPEDGSSLPTAPRSVELRFSEDIGSGFVAVTAPDGSQVATSEPEVDGNRVTATVASSDQKGRYTVAYRVLSGDGHPVEGTFTFTTTTGRTVTQQDPPSSESFMQSHGKPIILGLGAAVAVIVLILARLRRRRDA